MSEETTIDFENITNFQDRTDHYTLVATTSGGSRKYTMRFPREAFVANCAKALKASQLRDLLEKASAAEKRYAASVSALLGEPIAPAT